MKASQFLGICTTHPADAVQPSVLFLLSAFLAARLLFAAGLGPGFDEAYYYSYSLRPAWGYFDHPPLVALVAGVGPALSGSASALTGFIFPPESDCANFFRPVGLIRSPNIVTGRLSSMVTVISREHNLLRRGMSRFTNSCPCNASFIAIRCSGLLPQQAPMMLTPASANLTAYSANTSGGSG